MKKEKGQGQNTSKLRFLREREKKDDNKVKNAKGRIREVGKKNRGMHCHNHQPKREQLTV